MKILMFAIKLIPVITIVHGFVSSGVRVGSLVDTAKVAMTQYELAQISIVLAKPEHVKMAPERFSDFVREQYYGQYSVLARQVFGKSSETDVAIDLWGKPFQLVPIKGTGDIKIVSAGPDGKVHTKDDLVVEISGPAPINSLATTAPIPNRNVEKAPGENQANITDGQSADPANRAPASVSESREEGYDQEGHDRDGYDRDGYDQHGFDRDGFNQDGVDANGNQRPEENQ